MKNIIKIILLFSLTIFSFEVTRSIDRTALTLGEPLLLKIKAIKKQTDKLIFPGPDHNFGDFEIRNMRSYEEEKNGMFQEIYEYQLVSYKLGTFTIPKLKVINATDTSNYKFTESVEISVNTIKSSDTNDIVDIYDVEKIGYGKAFYITIIVVILLLIIILFFVDKYLKKRKLKIIEKPKIIIPPHIIFEKEISKLKQKDLLSHGNTKDFHFKISEILRRYVGNRFGFFALESTTSELFDLLESHAANREIITLIEKFCEINDPVKFAKWIPPKDISEKLYEISWEIVNSTKENIIR